MTIRIHVERMVLHGLDLDARGAEALRAAAGAELARLFEQQAPTALRDGAVPVLHAPPVQFEPNSSPARMGSHVARAVHGSFGR